MKAALRRKYCEPKDIQIENVEKPSPGEREVLVKVHATTVNRTDCANLTGKPFIMHFVLGFSKPRIAVLGTDYSGEVAAIGKGVTEFVPGQKVFGLNDIGSSSQAEFMLASSKDLYLIPEGIDYKTAAAALEGAHYAYSMLKRANVQDGQSVFINGATGAIGNALLQYVKQYGVYIGATCEEKNIELVKSLGADSVIDFQKEDFTQGDRKYDHVFDAVGKSTFGKCKKILKEKGIYISSELGPYAQNLYYTLKTKVFSSGRRVLFPVPFATSESIPYIIERLQNGVLKPVIDRSYPIDEAAAAYEYVIAGKKTCNVILEIVSN